MSSIFVRTFRCFRLTAYNFLDLVGACRGVAVYQVILVVHLLQLVRRQMILTALEIKHLDLGLPAGL